MSTGWITVLALGVGCYFLKAAGPLLLGGRVLPPWVHTLAQRLPAPLLAALVVVSGVGASRSWHVDARLVGVAVAALALRRRANFIVVVVGAAAATAITRGIAARL